jgi:hypothetical protein
MQFRTVLFVFFATTLVLAQLAPCPQGTARTSTGVCQEVTYIEGCFRYQTTKACAECEFNYDLVGGLCSYNEKDKKECCTKFSTNGECAECKSGLYLKDGACEQAFLTGCLTKDIDQCINCGSDFILRQGLCTPGVQNCADYSTKGECRRCKVGFLLANARLCTPVKIIGCSQQADGNCTKCFDPFELVNGICAISNCAKLTEFGCGECSNSYYLKSNGQCAQVEAGCTLYLHGRCANCSRNFLLQNGRCLMDGCKNQSAKGCVECNTEYELKNQTCFLPNCVWSLNRKCQLCADGFRIKGNTCVKPTMNCVDYIGEVCRECDNKFYLGKDSHCHAFEVGCV